MSAEHGVRRPACSLTICRSRVVKYARATTFYACALRRIPCGEKVRGLSSLVELFAIVGRHHMKDDSLGRLGAGRLYFRPRIEPFTAASAYFRPRPAGEI